MLQPWKINPQELLMIAQIERDETWLFGEKVGHEVDAKCIEVVTKVLEVVLKCAAQWRTNLESGSEDEISPVALCHDQFVSSCHLAA